VVTLYTTSSRPVRAQVESSTTYGELESKPPWVSIVSNEMKNLLRYDSFAIFIFCFLFYFYSLDRSPDYLNCQRDSSLKMYGIRKKRTSAH